MSIDFDDAVNTLKSMFEDVDRDVITYILEANEGHMERTVEALLKMTSEETQESLPERPVLTRENTFPRFRQHKIKLPDDFLRIPGEAYTSPPSIQSTSTNADQLRQDELLAELLQNEILLQELQQDPEFQRMLHAAEMQHVPHHHRQREVTENAETGPTISERLSNLRGAARRQFAELIARFRTGRNTNTETGEYASLSAEDETEVISFEDRPNMRHINRGDELTGTEMVEINFNDDSSLDDRRMARRRQKDD